MDERALRYRSDALLCIHLVVDDWLWRPLALAVVFVGRSYADSTPAGGWRESVLTDRCPAAMLEA